MADTTGIAWTNKTRFLSVEPLLEDLGIIDMTGINWVIVGGESGHGARRFELDWARSIQSQCDAAGVPWFFKQAGGNAWDWDRGDAPNQQPSELVQLALRDRKGGDMTELPAELQVQDFPCKTSNSTSANP